MKKTSSIALGMLLVLFGFSPIQKSSADFQQFHGPRIKGKAGTSTNWSGYAVETNLNNQQNNAISDVKGSWVVPSVTCVSSTNAYSSAWVGIDGYDDTTVEQIGTDQDCASGKPTYYAWYEMYPKPSYRISLSVKAGDTMTGEVKYNDSGNYTLKLTNVTTGKSFSTIQKSNKALRQSAEWIMEAPSGGGILPLANFGTINFSGASATLNGHTGSISNSSWQNDRIIMTTSSGTPKATPSLLSPDGSSFNVVWSHN